MSMRPVMWTGVLVPVLALAQSPAKTIDDGILDKIELYAEALDSPGTRTVLVRPFDSSTADLGTGNSEGKETRQKEAQMIQREGPKLLADTLASALQKTGPFKEVRVAEADSPELDGAVIIDGKFVTINPGSRAKRYFAGFGAGKSVIEVSGTVKDSAGKTLASFSQRRIGAMGFGGGDSLGKLMADTRHIGEDVAKFMEAWARGKSLD